MFASLCFAAIALFAEGEVEIVTVEADPVALSRLRVGLGRFIGVERFLDGSDESIHGI